MKIAIVVHGRFHAFDLARALLARGHHVTLFTNYPGWAVERFGISRTHVRSFVLHGGGTRVLHRMCQKLRLAYPEALAHQTFGSWAARQLKCEPWDVIYCFSGIAIERLRWCDAHCTEPAEMVWRMYHEYHPRDWNDVAADFERICEDALTRMA